VDEARCAVVFKDGSQVGLPDDLPEVDEEASAASE